MTFHKKRFSCAIRQFFFLTALFIIMTGCSFGGIGGAYQQLRSRPLSQTDPNLRTCVFNPSYSIVHFPMHHFPTSGGHIPLEDKERVTRSQFQLFHTVVDYKRFQWDVAFFDEFTTIDDYNENFFRILHTEQGEFEGYRRIDGTKVYLQKKLQEAKFLFQAGMPPYYELLIPAQKEFLFNIGAGFTLYLLGEIPRIHKSISPGGWAQVKANTQSASGHFYLEGNRYWTHTFREQELQKEVLNFFHRFYRPGILILIAYGASHDFSDEFAGRPFQSGNNICLQWVQ